MIVSFDSIKYKKYDSNIFGGDGKLGKVGNIRNFRDY